MFNELKERGYVYQATNEELIKKMINNEKITFYLGIDPTADSLHIGHFFALTLVRRLQKMGHHPIVLIGGATALIGDPSGRSDLRKTLSKEQVEYNKKEVIELVKKFVDVDGNNPAKIVDNVSWMKDNYIDFMRKVGVHFNVNKMLSTDCYKKRLEEGGLTFLEMGYMLMQAYDFVHLNETEGCVLQVGGSDQWANMVAGTELFRKMNNLSNIKNKEIEALTCPLLVKADGEKMGKTSSGTLWVSREKTTVYDFYQMFINSYDEDVERLLCFFSDYPVSEIKKMCKEDIIKAKKVMAFEVTKLVHGEEEAIKVQKLSEEIFSGNNPNNMPTVKIEDNNINVIDLMVKTNLVPSKSEARRLIEQGGIIIDKEKIMDTNYIVNRKEIVIQKGKKTYIKVILNEKI
ncbi:MAG: tyrosine--tRNA ligase [Tenericutes bacterium]|nr:tyrosine--tRNA ligase [Mycoplasmatota bacterium]